jgi:Flp pilus assembly protein TadG
MTFTADRRSPSAAPHLARLAARCREGIAAVEFAILVPIYLIILVGMVDLAGMLFTSYQLESAVAAAAQYAAVNSANVSGTNGSTLASAIASIVESANGSTSASGAVVVNNGPTVTLTGGSAASGGTAGNANSCYCPSGVPPSWTWGSAVVCGSTCAGGSLAGKFVAITASVPYTPLLTTFGLIKNGSLTQSALVQAQ